MYLKLYIWSTWETELLWWHMPIILAFVWWSQLNWVFSIFFCYTACFRSAVIHCTPSQIYRSNIDIKCLILFLNMCCKIWLYCWVFFYECIDGIDIDVDVTRDLDYIHEFINNESLLLLNKSWPSKSEAVKLVCWYLWNCLYKDV